MTGRGTVVVLALAGLAAAALLGLTGYFVARETIALPATSLPAGEDLAPVPTGPPTTARADTTPATTQERTETDDGRGRGRGRGRGGNTTRDDDRSGSDGSGRGRGRGRGGDD